MSRCECLSVGGPLPSSLQSSPLPVHFPADFTLFPKIIRVCDQMEEGNEASMPPNFPHASPLHDVWECAVMLSRSGCLSGCWDVPESEKNMPAFTVSPWHTRCFGRTVTM